MSRRTIALIAALLLVILLPGSRASNADESQSGESQAGESAKNEPREIDPSIVNEYRDELIYLLEDSLDVTELRNAEPKRVLRNAAVLVGNISGQLESEDAFYAFRTMRGLLEYLVPDYALQDAYYRFQKGYLEREASFGTSLERFSEAHEALDVWEVALEKRREAGRPEDASFVADRFLKTFRRTEVLLLEGLFDLATQEFVELRRLAGKIEEFEEKDPSVRSDAATLLDLETRILNNAERFEALIQKIERAQSQQEWARIDPRLSLRLATAHWWLADQKKDSGAEEAEHRKAAEAQFKNAIARAADDQTTRTAQRLYCHSLLSRGDWERAREEIGRYAQYVVADQDPFDLRMISFLGARLARETNDVALRDATLEESRRIAAATIEQWHSQPVREGGRGLLHYAETRLFFVEHLLNIARSAGNEALLDAWLELESVGSFVRQLGAPQLTAEELQASLGNRGALVFLASRDETLAIAVDAKSVRLFQLGSRFPIQKLRDFTLQILRDGVKNPRVDLPKLANAGRNLRELLLPAEIRPWLLTLDGLTIVDVDSLGALPYAVIDLEGKPLGTQVPFSRASSLTAEHVLAQREIPSPSAFAVRVVADPAYAESAELTPLPLDDAARDRLTDRFVGMDAEVFTGERATLGALLDSSDAAVLLCLTHGARLARERYAGLHLAPTATRPDGRVGIDDFSLAHSAPLAMIFACEGGRGPQRAGDSGVTDLGGAFLRAGALAAMTAAEDIEYAPTLKLSEEIHRSLAAGRTPAQALRDARRVMVGTRKWRDPSDWALITVHGAAHVPVLPVLAEYQPPSPPSGGGPLAVGLAILAIVIGGRAIRRLAHSRGS